MRGSTAQATWFDWKIMVQPSVFTEKKLQIFGSKHHVYTITAQVGLHDLTIFG
jgi:hypothetical protein